MAGGKDGSDFERWFVVGARMTGASGTETVQLAGVSAGSEVTSAFRSMGKMSVRKGLETMLVQWGPGCSCLESYDESCLSW